MFMDFNWEFRFPSVGNYILLKEWFSATTLHHGLLYRGKQSYLSPSLSSLFSIRFVGPLQFFLASLLVDHISASLCFPWPVALSCARLKWLAEAMRLVLKKG